MPESSNLEALLLDLLAVVHRDGGQYTGAHGIEQSCVDARQAVVNAYSRVTDLEDMLFARGAMLRSPCFLCGYHGPGYHQESTHPCAERHHRLYKS